MSTSGELEINSTIAGSYEKLVKQEDANKKLYGAEGKEMLKTIAGHQDQLDGPGQDAAQAATYSCEVQPRHGRGQSLTKGADGHHN